MKKIRILVVDDQSVVREGIVAIISLQKDMEVVGEAEDGIQSMELAKKTNPDVILLDLVMPRQDGLTSIPKLKEIVPRASIVVLTGFSESNRAYQAIKAGAVGYLLKDTTRVQLLQSIRDVANGHASIHPSIALKVIQDFDKAKESTYMNEPLTRRELETLQLLARGYSNQEIGAHLFVHERTVAKYVSNILGKLHLVNRTQAALYAIKEGLSACAD